MTITDSQDYLLEGKLAYREAQGNLSLLYLKLTNSDDLVVVKSPGTINLKTDDILRVNPSMEKRYLFNDQGVNFTRCSGCILSTAS